MFYLQSIRSGKDRKIFRSYLLIRLKLSTLNKVVNGLTIKYTTGSAYPWLSPSTPSSDIFLFGLSMASETLNNCPLEYIYQFKVCNPIPLWLTVLCSLLHPISPLTTGPVWREMEPKLQTLED